MVEEQNGKIDNIHIKREVDRIQRIVEGQNLEIKKTLYKYSNIIEQQRKIVFENRYNALIGNSSLNIFETKSPAQFQKLNSILNEEKLRNISKHIYQFHSDDLWSSYLAEIADIREGIHLKSIAGRSPIIEFQKIAIELFEQLNRELEEAIIQSFNKLKIKGNEINLDDEGLKAPSATWTYMINDNPFEKSLGMQLIGNTGLSVGAGFEMAPMLMLYLLWRKISKQGKKAL